LGPRAHRDVAEWFDKHADLTDCAFMIAVAILSGVSYQAVADASRRLQELLEALEPADPDEQKPKAAGKPLFGTTRTQRLKDVGARLESGYQLAEFGLSRSSWLCWITRLSSQPCWSTSGGSTTWSASHCSPGSRSLARTAISTSGSGAAAAVGKLAEYDFGHIRSEVLNPWATDGNEWAREAAAAELGVPAWGSEVTPQTFGLLHHWSTLKDNLHLRWSAAAAYGGLAGLRFPELALHELGRILGAEDLRLLGVCSRSVLGLFDAGAYVPELHLLVLDALDDWSTQRARTSVLALSSLSIGLWLAWDAELEPASYQGQIWPTLLWLIDEDGPEREKAVALLRRALDAKEIRGAALDVLHQWVLRADDSPDIASTLESLLLELAQGDYGRERERLHVYLSRWASDPERRSPFAERVRPLLS
jgi:hypothetical protein